ncbi:MAG: UDP-3-O-acyl-N-acetylglucosamine deacetylase [Proteobacteria bacterium]|nr:UDP-3-O-acyl-N-acetylglucosamine deacetylase [Pseudomonadota bacterium]
MIITYQRTINSKVNCNGIGIHSGANVKMSLLPAPADTGIVFKRTDIGGVNGVISANYKNVCDTNLGTTIANSYGTKISTIEHLMAAIWGCGIDNLIVEVNGPELPIMDGSSEPFVFLIECAGSTVQDKPRRVIEIMKKIEIQENDKTISIEPGKEFAVDFDIDFNHKQVQKQKYDFHSTHTSFKNDLCRARTFGFQHEIEMLHKMGLARGGSLDNAIVVGEEGVVNAEGLRYDDEFVRHKTLDFIGDIYLAGGYIAGHFTASKAGHGINNKMLHKLFADESCWRTV